MRNIKRIVVIAFLQFMLIFPLLAQREVSYRVVLDDSQVPKEVMAGFKTSYPQVPFFIWYTSHITYWYEDYAQTWYGAWYPVRQTVVHRFEKPAYYEVDFKQNNESSRAIFSRYGQWLETRTRIVAFPEEVIQGLKNSEFGDWQWSEHKERIEALGLPGSVYRLQVSNKEDAYIVRLDESGEIIQVKYD
jgi:hypothetical protein